MVAQTHLPVSWIVYVNYMHKDIILVGIKHWDAIKSICPRLNCYSVWEADLLMYFAIAFLSMVRHKSLVLQFVSKGILASPSAQNLSSWQIVAAYCCCSKLDCLILQFLAPSFQDHYSLLLIFLIPHYHFTSLLAPFGSIYLTVLIANDSCILRHPFAPVHSGLNRNSIAFLVRLVHSQSTFLICFANFYRSSFSSHGWLATWTCARLSSFIYR